MSEGEKSKDPPVAAVPGLFGSAVGGGDSRKSISRQATRRRKSFARCGPSVEAREMDPSQDSAR
jgi:hypothetical protein